MVHKSLEGHMRKNRVAASLATALFVALVTSFVLIACGTSQPSLSATVLDGAEDVPLTADLKVRAQGAVLQHAVLERVEPPGERLELSVTEAEARLTGKLDPDTRYRLVATAQAQEPTPLPWLSRAMTMLSLERNFSTVQAPALVRPDSPLMAFPGKPIDLRFSEPIARAEVQALGHAAEAQIVRTDPHVLRVQVKDPVPGQEVTLRLVDVVGVNGAPAEDARVSVHTPEAVTLASVSGVTAPGRLQVPSDRPLTVEWSRPVTAFRYTVDDAAKTWSGDPNLTIRLPVHSVPGRSIMVTINEATAEDGGWLPTAQTFELVSPAPLRIAATWPEAGATNISVTGDPTIRFSEPISIDDQALAEAAIEFDPPVPGRFQWLTRDRVRFLPENSFPRMTDMTMTVRAGSDGVRAESGSMLEESFSLVFQTGRNKVIDVSLSRQVMTLLEDDAAIWSAPVATGVRGAETPIGTYSIQAKMARARFRGVNPDGSRYDIPNVNWVLPFWGDYTIHGAHWRGRFGAPASNGCISLTDANAKFVFDWAEEGTTLIVRR
jgi:lipoprotein-anchoring transpeptidase ErfK/SrfK